MAPKNNFILLVLGLISSGLLSGCSTICCHISKAGVIPGSAYYRMPDSGPMVVLVFTPLVKAGQKPMRVLMLHEINGMTPAFAYFAMRLASRGFTVYAPVLVGKPLESGAWPTARNFGAIMLNPKWPVWVGGYSPPVVPQLRDLLRRISPNNEPVGIIGQCFTGTTPIALMNEPSARIAALCEPALPIWPVTFARRHDLALSEEDVAGGIKRINDEALTVLGFRFTGDSLSTEERFTVLQEKIDADACKRHIAHPGHLTSDPIENGATIPKCAHAVFAEDYDAGGVETKKRFEELVSTFTQALQTGAAVSPGP